MSGVECTLIGAGAFIVGGALAGLLGYWLGTRRSAQLVFAASEAAKVQARLEAKQEQDKLRREAADLTAKIPDMRPRDVIEALRKLP